MDTFSAAVAEWAKKAEAKQVAVAQMSMRLLDEEVIEHVTRKTGNLANSREVSTSGRTTIDWRTKKFRDPSDQINNAIAGIDLNQTAYYGFRAPYAFKVEKAHGFFRLIAQRWSDLVQQAAKRVGS